MKQIGNEFVILQQYNLRILMPNTWIYSTTCFKYQEWTHKTTQLKTRIITALFTS